MRAESVQLPGVMAATVFAAFTYEQKNSTTNIKILLSIVCCFQFGIVLAQSFTKRKGQHNLLLVYSNDRKSIKAVHFILQNSNVPNGCILCFD